MKDKWSDYRDIHVALDFIENKWEFAGRHYKRRGQAEKAAWKEWRKIK